MAWTVPITWLDGDPLTAAQLNTCLRDNMLETEVAKASAASRLIVTDATNSVRERQWARGYSTSAIITSAQFPTVEDSDDDTEFGPAVTVEHGGQLLVMYDAGIWVTAGAAEALCGPMLNGRLPQDTNETIRSGRGTFSRGGAWTLYVADPGIATVSMAYGLTGTDSTALFSHIKLSVLPF